MNFHRTCGKDCLTLDRTSRLVSHSEDHVKNHKGPAPHSTEIARSRRSGCASTILAYVFAALAFFSAFGSTRSAYAQDDAAAADAVANDAPSGDAAAASDAASPARAPAQGQIAQAVTRAEQTTGVTVGGRCAPGEPDCLEVVEETEHREVRFACRQGTADCVDENTCGGDRGLILAQRAQAQVRRFRREVRRELTAIHHELNAIRAVNAVQDERISALENYDQQFFGWSADTSPRERMRIARETGRYLHDVVPSLIMEEEIDRMEVDGELRGAIDAAERARRDFEQRANDKFAEIERSITAINARLDAASGRQWLGPSVGLFSSSCPNDHNCWTGVTGGFGYAGRPVGDSWFGVTGSLDLGHLWGRSGAYDAFLISARATLGYQSPSNRWGIGIGGQLMAMLTLQTDGGMAFMGGGPMVAGWYKPTDWIRVGLEVGGMFGTVRVAGEREATGHGEDHSAFTGRGFVEIPIKGF